MTIFVDDWCRQLQKSECRGWPPWQKRCVGFRSAIFDGWVYPISNGKLEGIYNKIA
jgi:hypothetical protein